MEIVRTIKEAEIWFLRNAEGEVECINKKGESRIVDNYPDAEKFLSTEQPEPADWEKEFKKIWKNDEWKYDEAVNFISTRISNARQEEEAKWRKLLNSGKQMYELGKKEERERINCAVEKLRIPDDWNKGKNTDNRIADIVGTNLSATERYNSVLNEISILINKLT